MNLGNLIADEPWKPYSKGKAPVTTGHAVHDCLRGTSAQANPQRQKAD